MGSRLEALMTGALRSTASCISYPYAVLTAQRDLDAAVDFPDQSTYVDMSPQTRAYHDARVVAAAVGRPLSVAAHGVILNFAVEAGTDENLFWMALATNAASAVYEGARKWYHNRQARLGYDSGAELSRMH